MRSEPNRTPLYVSSLFMIFTLVVLLLFVSHGIFAKETVIRSSKGIDLYVATLADINYPGKFVFVDDKGKEHRLHKIYTVFSDSEEERTEIVAKEVPGFWKYITFGTSYYMRVYRHFPTEP